MGNFERSILLTVVRRLCGHASGVPNRVFGQSKFRVSSPISPPPCKKGKDLCCCPISKKLCLRGYVSKCQAIYMQQQIIGRRVNTRSCQILVKEKQDKIIIVEFECDDKKKLQEVFKKRDIKKHVFSSGQAVIHCITNSLLRAILFQTIIYTNGCITHHNAYRVGIFCWRRSST